MKYAFWEAQEGILEQLGPPEWYNGSDILQEIPFIVNLHWCKNIERFLTHFLFLIHKLLWSIRVDVVLNIKLTRSQGVKSGT